MPTLNDRLALELGRAVLRAVTAEAQRDEALAAASESPRAEQPAAKPARRKRGT